MLAEPMTLYKLMNLYMLHQVNFPLTNAQLSNFFLDREYTTYFTLQQALNELLDAGLVKKETMRNSSRYEITKEGEETLEFFGKNIPTAMRNDADKFLTEHHYQLKNENTTLADYYQEKPNLFIVNCEIREENHKLIALSLSVTTKEQAIAICDNWKKHNADIYTYLIQTLLMGKK